MTYADILEQGFDLDGTEGDDTLTGTAVTDRMDGKGGNDSLIAGAGELKYNAANDAFLREVA
jgi:Ca2+-binding RTX toxin-like protein